MGVLLMNGRILLLIALLLFCGGKSSVDAAPPPIEMEIVTEPGTAVDVPHKWIAMLQGMGFSNLRVRAGERGDAAAIHNRGTEEHPRYSVTGIATSANVLKLPGGTIRLGDKGAMQSWIANLQDGGKDGVVAEKVMFGLSRKQMLAVHEALRAPVGFPTKGKRTAEVLKKIVDTIDLKVTLDRSAADAARSDEPVADEFQGISCGTAMAAVLRPLGYVFAPEKPRGGDLQLRVAESSSVKETWPIGWDSPTAAGKLAPAYFKTTNTEINEYVLAEVLDVVQKRVELPLVFDYNALARERVKIDEVKVSSKKGKKSYASLVNELLYKAQLKAEMRIDEAEQPFLWITTLRQPK